MGPELWGGKEERGGFGHGGGALVNGISALMRRGQRPSQLSFHHKRAPTSPDNAGTLTSASQPPELRLTRDSARDRGKKAEPRGGSRWDHWEANVQHAWRGNAMRHHRPPPTSRGGAGQGLVDKVFCRAKAGQVCGGPQTRSGSPKLSTSQRRIITTGSPHCLCLCVLSSWIYRRAARQPSSYEQIGTIGPSAYTMPGSVPSASQALAGIIEKWGRDLNLEDAAVSYALLPWGSQEIVQLSQSPSSKFQVSRYEEPQSGREVSRGSLKELDRQARKQQARYTRVGIQQETGNLATGEAAHNTAPGQQDRTNRMQKLDTSPSLVPAKSGPNPHDLLAWGSGPEEVGHLDETGSWESNDCSCLGLLPCTIYSLSTPTLSPGEGGHRRPGLAVQTPRQVWRRAPDARLSSGEGLGCWRLVLSKEAPPAPGFPGPACFPSQVNEARPLPSAHAPPRGLEGWSHPGPIPLLSAASLHQRPACRHAAPAPAPAVAPQSSHPVLRNRRPAALWPQTEEVKRAFFSKSKENGSWKRAAAPPRLRPARDPANPAPHSCLVELSEAYQALNQGQSRRSYDRQLRWATFPKFPGTTVHPSLLIKHTAPGHPPVHNTGPSFMVQQPHKHNQRVLGYCLMITLAGRVLHYVAFGKLEQMHRPGPTEPGSSRSNSRDSSYNHHPGLLKAPGSCPLALAPKPLTWMGPEACSLLAFLLGHPTPQNAWNKINKWESQDEALCSLHSRPRAWRTAGSELRVAAGPMADEGPVGDGEDLGDIQNETGAERRNLTCASQAPLAARWRRDQGRGLVARGDETGSRKLVWKLLAAAELSSQAEVGTAVRFGMYFSQESWQGVLTVWLRMVWIEYLESCSWEGRKAAAFYGDGAEWGGGWFGTY
ncbi:DnaJ-like protein subfamily C member 4 [Camelus dromedarius]|uniref:DnaJ-like protein subfamily C member 4 n=1 Tax=Camelus dromedarius TaxID=9838 RepID=A0A5N4C604_CAMDR|nr:DnaJ-like protein subfamily C member 4 [Camelus dromedarius]